MKRASLRVAIPILGFAVTTLYVGLAASPGQAASRQSEAVSRGRNIFGQACIQCHQVGHSALQRKTEAGWTDTVYSMIARGAPVLPDEIEPLIAYLTATYGPDSPLPMAEDSRDRATLPDEPGRAILVRSCTACHSLALVTGTRKSTAEWEETITRMLSFGAALTPDERQTVGDYVTQNFGLAPQ